FDFAGAAAQSASEHEQDHDHDHDHDHGHEHGHAHDAHHHHHDESIASCYLTEERPLDLKQVEAWLTEIIRDLGPDMYRSKGILQIKGQAKRVVFQGVQTIFDARPDRFWNPGEPRRSQMVFIGKNLDETKLRAGLDKCIAG